MVIFMEDGVLDSDYGYGELGNAAEVVEMEDLSYEEQKLMLKNYGQRILKVIMNGKNIV